MHFIFQNPTTDNTKAIAPRWIMSGYDLPTDTDAATFTVTSQDGTSARVVLKGRTRQVAETLAIGPIYCASPVRLSHYVMLLRDEHGLDVETIWHEDHNGPQVTRYGVYELLDRIAPTTERGAV